MTLNLLFRRGLVFVAILTSLAVKLGPLAYRAEAQRFDGDDENRGRGGDEPSPEEMRRNWERWREMRRAQGGGEGDWGGEGRGGGFRRRDGFEPGSFEGGFGGEGGEGREFRRRFGGGEGGGRPGFRRNRSENDSNDNDDEGNGDEEENRDRRRGERREERRDQRRSGNAAMDPGDYARSLLKDRDKNGNGTLEGDEIRDLPSSAASADADKNNVITRDELVARLTNRDGGRNGEGGRSNTGSSASKSAGGATTGMATRVFTALVAPGGTGEKSSTSAKRTYRFTPPSERAGLPGWIKSRDRDKNGQVEMSEFGRTWSKRTVADFRRYDLNDDGIVTAKEATASGAK